MEVGDQDIIKNLKNSEAEKSAMGLDGAKKRA